jgi:hypothetical protein
VNLSEDLRAARTGDAPALVDRALARHHGQHPDVS